MAASGGYGLLGEAEHVGAEDMLSAAVALVRRELAIWVDLCLEPLQEGLTGWPGAGAAVNGATP